VAVLAAEVQGRKAAPVLDVRVGFGLAQNLEVLEQLFFNFVCVSLTQNLRTTAYINNAFYSFNLHVHNFRNLIKFTWLRMFFN